MKSISNILVTCGIYAICIIFFAAVAYDLTPFLRGPGLGEWQWPYQFINTMHLVWQPGLVMVAILGLFWLSERKLGQTGKLMILVGLVGLSFAWFVAVGNFSRVGSSYWVQRTVTADLNGYYTTGVNISNPQKFVRDFPGLVNSLPMHAKGHPPGGALFYYFLNLFLGQGFAAVYSPFLLAFLAGLAIPLVYLTTKNFRATFFSATIPSLALFMPLLDVIYPLFGLVALLLAVRRRGFIAGIIFGLGLFFSYSILPVLVVTLSLIKNRRHFLAGILVFIAAAQLLGFDFIRTTLTVIGNQAPRNFWVWLFYNPYDFVVFLGLPLAILGWFGVEKKLLVIFLSIFLTVFSRGEVGRIWLPLMPFAAIFAGNFLSKRKFEPTLVGILLVLQMVQTLVLQEFWVPLW